jgi:(p)ppGpp synthase/HD superfamily hydrolase
MITSKTLEKAIMFAVKAHKGQKRKGDGCPYIVHPAAVMTTLRRVKKTKNIYLLAAATILHDTVEDCGVKLKTIAKKFGYSVAALVQELTLDKKQYELVGKKEYLAQELINMSSYALCIKLCDRYDNVVDMRTMPEAFKENYRQETIYILSKLCGSKRDLTKTHKRIINLITEELMEKSIYSKI